MSTSSPVPKTADSKDLNTSPPEPELHPLVYEQRCKDFWMFLIILRCINAVCVRTFFQPDEYFQSLEPAWQMAFGTDSGAWITWEWQYQLRSSLHPALFAGIYYVANKSMTFVSIFPQVRAMALSILPNIVQAFFAGASDYYTWQLAERIYGQESNAGWAALLMTVFSPWQWFCSTRTFSNCVETTLTIAALYHWPWSISLDPTPESSADSTKSPEKSAATPARPSTFGSSKSVNSLRIALLLAGTACILRPTNGLIWFPIVMPIINRILSSSTRMNTSDYIILIREAILCGSLILLVSGISDRLYFGEWTFPPYQWLNFNVNQDLAIFYGRNDWHYYLSQGLPLLLTTFLPFGLWGILQATTTDTNSIPFLLCTTLLTTITSLSLIAHKEVRFIYPLLPILHVLAAPSIWSFFHTTATKTTHPPPFPSTPVTKTVTIINHKLLLTLLVAVNVMIGGYTTLYHQRGVLSVLTFLRQDFEAHHLTPRGIPFPTTQNETFAAFLMPCHSTPWRSQLFHPSLHAWALTCDPPIHIPAGTPERLAYLDEADRFYADPVGFLKREVGGRERPWPRYVVGFEGIEGWLRTYYREVMGEGFVVRERWRGGNTDWIDDERRNGNVVVWEFGEAEAGVRE
ncbi:glycosyltransferase family 22 protein [Halenospora varia]|nr:glycosyltransferase family 22 protein [Halenospora varia]